MRSRVAKITSKGQVTIPAEIRQRLGLAPHDKVEFLVEDDQVRLTPATNVVARTAGLLKGEEPMLSARDEKAAVERTIAEEADKLGYQPGQARGSHRRKKR